MAVKQAAAERRRRRIASIGAGAGVLVVVAAVIIMVATLGGHKKSSASAAASASASASPSATAFTPGPCKWTKSTTASQTKSLANLGMPPTSGEPRGGTETMTINTNLGAITVAVDVAHAPCTAESFSYLASKNFFNNTQCHRLTTSGIYVLQCGDPTGTGSGGPGYEFNTEYVPTDGTNIYKAGWVAMANTGQPGTNGSQFFIVYKDSQLSPDYTVFGQVTKGLDIVQKVAAGGVKPTDPNNPSDGAPKITVDIKSLTVSKPVGPTTSSASPSVTPSPTKS